MTRIAMFGIDILAVAVLVFGLYFPRHRRRDLVVAYLGVNVGVLVVASALSGATVGAGLGLGLGLFGVLSIIRLRSTELDQHEVAYYFCALALGLLGALGGSAIWIPASMMALLLLVMYIGDHRRMFRTYQHQVMVIDSAITDRVALIAHLEQLLGARVHSATVQRLDLVNDTTVVDVRFSQPARSNVSSTPSVRHAVGPAPVGLSGSEAHR